MIIANITSWIGYDSQAEHYYCQYRIVDDLINMLPSKHYQGGSFNKDELSREITDQAEIDYINSKDRFSGFYIGDRTNRFQSVEQIHGELRNLFQFQDMVTYYEGEIFKEMVYIFDGVDLGVQGFGEQFMNVPQSCYKDLLPELSTIKIKCYNCGHEYTLDEVAYYTESGTRALLKFIRKRDMDETCCTNFDLMWNVVL